MYVLKTSDLLNVELFFILFFSACVMLFFQRVFNAFFQPIFIFIFSSFRLFAQASLLPARTLRRFVQQAVGCHDEEAEASVEEAFGEIGVDR